MTIEEFSNEFDVLASSYLVEGGFTVSDSSLYAFNEYEKSLFLTNAQKQYVLSLYNGKNTSGDAFEGTEEMRRYLHNLVAENYSSEPLDKTVQKNYLDKSYYGMKGNPYVSTMFKLPDDLWFITYESVETKADSSKGACDGKYSIVQDVIPVTQDEFHRIKRNPFRGPSFHRALRLDLSDTDINPNSVVEIISKYPIGSYYVRYIKKLEPIILIDLPDGLSIDGESKACECKLHEAVHHTILELAVRMALASRSVVASGKSKKDED